MNRKRSSTGIMILLVTVIFLSGCKKADTSSPDYYVRFTANGQRYEHHTGLEAKLIKSVDDDGMVSWDFFIGGGTQDSTKIQVEATIYHHVIESKKYIDTDEDSAVSIRFRDSGYSGLDDFFPTEITFTAWSDEYVKGQFSGLLHREIIFSSSGEPQGMLPITITEGEFYVPLTTGQ